MVCVGVTKTEVLKYLRKVNARPDLIKKLEDKRFDTEDKAAFVWTPSNTGCTLLWMSEFLGNDEDMFTLVHETNHLLYDISRDKGFQNEAEINAYQQEYLFKQIWTELKKRKKKFGIKSSTKKRQYEKRKRSKP
jgi:hypothetical protein